MTAPIDIRGILERAGADAFAPEGSQALALAQVGEVVEGLIEAAEKAIPTLRCISGIAGISLAGEARLDKARIERVLCRIRGAP